MPDPIPCRSIARPLVASLVLGLLVGCSGDPGPMGPPGPAGPGSRQVFSGTISAAASTSSGQVIAIPSLNVGDFPLVGVYVADSNGAWAQLNLVVYNPQSAAYDLFEVAILEDGRITLFSSFVGSSYRIVVVT